MKVLNIVQKLKGEPKRLTALVLLAVFLVIFVLTCLTPLLADDFSYKFSYADRSKRVSGLTDIVESMVAHRQSMNGRVFSHSLAHFFLMLPKIVFNVFNGLNAAFIVFIMAAYYKGNSTANRLMLMILSALAIWHFVPDFGQVFLWLDGSLNYSWTAAVVLLYIYPFFSAYAFGRSMFNGKWGKVLAAAYLLFSFVAGGYSESASCAALFIAGAFLLMSFLRDKSINKLLLMCLCVAGLGFLFMMSAPAEMSGRTSEMSIGMIAHNIQRVFTLPRDYLLELYCIFAALFVVCITARIDSKIVWSAGIFFLGSVLAIGVFVFASYLPPRALCVPTIYLITACLILLNAFVGTGIKYLLPALTAVMSVICVFSFVLGVGDIAVVYYESMQREAAIYSAIEAGEDHVQIYKYSGVTKYNGAYDLPDAHGDPNDWPNDDMARYYGIESITAVSMSGDYFEWY